MSAAYELWEHDPAHNALVAWLAAWRLRGEAVAGERLPAYTFAEHIGRTAVRDMRSGVSKPDMARIYSAAGYDGTCPCCNRTPDDLVSERAAQIVDERHSHALTLARSGGNVRA